MSDVNEANPAVKDSTIVVEDLENGPAPASVPLQETNDDSVSPEQNTAALTLGSFGHVFRRVYHISLFTSLSALYYAFGDDIDEVISWGPNGIEKLIALGALLQIVLEAIRIKMGFICVGFRSYEKHQISAQAWGTVGAVLVLLASPIANGKTRIEASPAERAYIGMPILWTLGIVDPLIGELKSHGIFGRWIRKGQGFTVPQRLVIATVVTALIWMGIWLVLDEAVWWFLPIVAPLTVAAEYPSLKIIDDNAMMELVPLAAALLLRPLF